MSDIAHCESYGRIPTFRRSMFLRNVGVVPQCHNTEDRGLGIVDFEGKRWKVKLSLCH